MLKVITKKNNFKDLIYSNNKKLLKGEVVLTLSGKIFDHPTRESIQIGENKHILDELGQFTNHSCYPSCVVTGNQLISIKEIKKGDSITFDYSKTEDFLASPFKCSCCNKLISGKLAAGTAIPGIVNGHSSSLANTVSQINTIAIKE